MKNFILITCLNLVILAVAAGCDENAARLYMEQKQKNIQQRAQEHCNKLNMTLDHCSEYGMCVAFDSKINDYVRLDCTDVCKTIGRDSEFMFAL